MRARLCEHVDDVPWLTPRHGRGWFISGGSDTHSTSSNDDSEGDTDSQASHSPGDDNDGMDSPLSSASSLSEGSARTPFARDHNDGRGARRSMLRRSGGLAKQPSLSDLIQARVVGLERGAYFDDVSQTVKPTPSLADLMVRCVCVWLCVFLFTCSCVASLYTHTTWLTFPCLHTQDFEITMDDLVSESMGNLGGVPDSADDSDAAPRSGAGVSRPASTTPGPSPGDGTGSAGDEDGTQQPPPSGRASTLPLQALAEELSARRRRQRVAQRSRAASAMARRAPPRVAVPKAAPGGGASDETGGGGGGVVAGSPLHRPYRAMPRPSEGGKPPRRPPPSHGVDAEARHGGNNADVPARFAMYMPRGASPGSGTDGSSRPASGDAAPITGAPRARGNRWTPPRAPSSPAPPASSRSPSSASRRVRPGSGGGGRSRQQRRLRGAGAAAAATPNTAGAPHGVAADAAATAGGAVAEPPAQAPSESSTLEAQYQRIMQQVQREQAARRRAARGGFGGSGSGNHPPRRRRGSKPSARAKAAKPPAAAPPRPSSAGSMSSGASATSGGRGDGRGNGAVGGRPSTVGGRTRRRSHHGQRAGGFHKSRRRPRAPTPAAMSGPHGASAATAGSDSDGAGVGTGVQPPSQSIAESVESVRACWCLFAVVACC